MELFLPRQSLLGKRGDCRIRAQRIPTGCPFGLAVLYPRVRGASVRFRLFDLDDHTLPTRVWGFTSLPKHSERLCGLWSNDHSEAIPYFQGGVWGWDNLIAVAVHGDEYTPGWQP